MTYTSEDHRWNGKILTWKPYRGRIWELQYNGVGLSIEHLQYPEDQHATDNTFYIENPNWCFV